LNKFNTLQQKRILVVVPHYYEYHVHIQQSLQSLGAIVTTVDNKAFQNSPDNRGTKWYSATASEKTLYISTKILPLCDHYYDICLFVNLFSFQPEILKKLRAANPKINCILYLWDNIKGYKWEINLPLFDRVTFFSSDEAKNYGGSYLPIFFVGRQSKEMPPELTYDLMTVCSYQAHRNSVLNKIALNATHNKKTVYFHLYKNIKVRRFKFIPRRLSEAVSGVDRSSGFIKYEKLVFDTVLSLMDRSRCIVDMPYPEQKGSTHRLIQALSMNKKVLSTDAAVVDEDFYDNDLIKVIGPDVKHIDWDWVTHPAKRKADVDHLRIDRWLVTLLT
jgi:hypothetical protein